MADHIVASMSTIQSDAARAGRASSDGSTLKAGAVSPYTAAHQRSYLDRIVGRTIEQMQRQNLTAGQIIYVGEHITERARDIQAHEND